MPTQPMKTGPTNTRKLNGLSKYMLYTILNYTFQFVFHYVSEDVDRH